MLPEEIVIRLNAVLSAVVDTENRLNTALSGLARGTPATALDEGRKAMNNLEQLFSCLEANRHTLITGLTRD